MSTDRERVEALAKVIAAEVWRIHGPESTDRESAEMDGEDIAKALLDSPAMRDLLAEAKADALREAANELWLEADSFREGGRTHAAFRDASRMVRRRVLPNPYRETSNGGSDD